MLCRLIHESTYYESKTCTSLLPSVVSFSKEAAIADKLVGRGVLNQAPPVRQCIEFALG
ncbi:hypothetical protein [Microcystis aeruginosa]|uniref:hypothetical protein n=1 Tax=Microcystis aeruginosa TaxID=1126 RepID=UPI0015627CA7|nr:hypothetical protein [Microcystis aeruginosa]